MVIIHYLLGAAWVLIYTAICYLPGTAFCPKKTPAPACILCGYILTALPAAVWGILVQVFNTTWQIFAIPYLIWIVTIGIFSIFIIHRENKPFFEPNFFRRYWFLFFLVILIMAITVLRFPDLWQANHSDDGYYVSKIASLPYVSQPFQSNAATGMEDDFYLSSYTLNTYELEMSVWCWLFKIPAPLFTRGFLSAFNYFLTSCTIFTFTDILRQRIKLKPGSYVQFSAMILLLFIINYYFLISRGLMNLPDNWGTSAAMFYGSAVTRFNSVFWLAIPYFWKPQISWKWFFAMAITGLVLISRSTIAIPVIYTVFTSLLVCHFLFSLSNNRNTAFGWLTIITLTICNLIAFILIQRFNIQFLLDTMWASRNVFRLNLLNYCSTIAVFIMLIAVFWVKKRVIYSLAVFILLVYTQISMPILQSMVAVLSVYTFVAERFFSSISYFLIISAWIIFLFFIIQKVQSRRLLSLAAICGVSLGTTVNLYAIHKVGGNPYVTDGQPAAELNLWTALNVYLKNPYLAPDKTMKLGAVLEDLNETRGQVRLFMPEPVLTDGVNDLSNLYIRGVSPHSICISASWRFEQKGKTEPNPMVIEDIWMYNEFLLNPNEETFEKLKSFLKTQNINTIVTLANDIYTPYMEEIGYNFYSAIINHTGIPEYYIFTSLQ